MHLTAVRLQPQGHARLWELQHLFCCHVCTLRAHVAVTHVCVCVYSSAISGVPLWVLHLLYRLSFDKYAITVNRGGSGEGGGRCAVAHLCDKS